MDYKEYYIKQIVNLAKEKGLNDYNDRSKIEGASEIQLINLWDSLRMTYGDLSKKSK